MPTLCHCAASFNLFLYLVALGLHWCGGLSLGERGLLLVAVPGLLTGVAFPVVDRGL